MIPVSENGLLIVELSSGINNGTERRINIDRRDRPGGESTGGVADLIIGGAIESERGHAGCGAVERNACVVPLLANEETARVAQVTGKNNAPVDDSKVG